MGAGMVTLTVTPGYLAIGLAAPLIVLTGRLVQGFSAGAELGNVSVYLAEIAPPGRRGLFVAWQSASQQVAVIVAAGMGALVSLALAPAQLQSWGWRIPLAVGCLIVPLLFLLRRHLTETEAFTARASKPTLPQVLAGLWRGRSRVALGLVMVLMTTVSFYTITAYTPSFGRLLRLPDGENLAVTAGVGLSNLVWLPLMGAVSDRIGRRPILIACTALAVLTAYPAMAWLAAAPSVPRLLAVELWLSALYASYNSAMVVSLTEIIPPEVRASGFSLAYSLATAVRAASRCVHRPPGLIKRTGDVAMPGAWLTLAAAPLALGAAMNSTARRAPWASVAP